MSMKTGFMKMIDDFKIRKKKQIEPILVENEE